MGTGNLRPFSEMLDLWFRKKIQLVPDNRIHGEGRVNVLGNKENGAQIDKWILPGLLPFGILCVFFFPGFKAWWDS